MLSKLNVLNIFNDIFYFNSEKVFLYLKFVDKKNIVNEMPTVTTQNQKLIHHGKNSLTNAIKRR